MNAMKNCFLICALLFFVSGCFEEIHRDDTSLDTALDVVESLVNANTASTPLNPYAAPIGVGLAGVAAMLEALRRKEKSGRKRAEANNHATGETRKTNG